MGTGNWRNRGMGKQGEGEGNAIGRWRALADGERRRSESARATFHVRIHKLLRETHGVQRSRAVPASMRLKLIPCHIHRARLYDLAHGIALC